MREDVINRIIQRRELMGISKLEMSKRVGVSYFGYRRMEDGENVGIDILFKSLEVLGLEINLKAT